METGEALNELTQLLGVSTPVGNSVTAQQYVTGVTSAVTPVAEVLAGGSASRVVTSSELPDSETSALIRQLTELTNVAREQAQSTEANTLAVVENSVVQATETQGSKIESVGKTILSFVGSGFGIAQVLDKIFSGSDESTTASTTGYLPPSPVSVEAGVYGGLAGLHPIQYGQTSLPRAAAPVGQKLQTPVTIQVQAMDSRSIIDHSSEIAEAVKEALLNSHSLNDVVTEI
jgi:hypothetical protein